MTKDEKEVSSIKITDFNMNTTESQMQALQMIGLKNSIESNQIKIDKGAT